jgi:flavin reductase (DIM6/NTAB) family NADH-FMN oxidoreductase RutF
MMTAGTKLAALLDPLENPMFILTVAWRGERSGCLMGFATRTSLDPVRFLACVSRSNHTYAIAMEAGHVAVHLAPDEPGLVLARLFGEETGDEVDKFSRCGWREGPAGQPVLAGCPGWFVGRVLSRHELGDHTGLLLEPVAVEGEARNVLSYRRARALHSAH